MPEDIILRPEFDDSEIVKGWQSVLQSTSEAQKQIKNALEESNKFNISLGKQMVDSTQDAEKAFMKSFDKIIRDQKLARKELTGAAKDVKILGVSYSDIAKKLESYRANLSKIPKVFKTGSVAAKGFTIALGPISIALAAITALLTGTQKGMDFVNRTIAAGKEVISSFVDGLSSLGGGLVKLLKFDFKGAVDDFKQAGNELVSIGKDAVDAWNLEGSSQSLRDDQQVLRREFAKTRTEIKALNLLIEDTTKPLKERANAAQRAGKLETDILNKRLLLENENIRILKERQALGKNTIKEEEELTAAIERREALKQESLELQTTIQNKLNTILNEGRASSKAAQDQYKKQLDELNKSILEVDLDKLSPIDRIEKEGELTIEALESQKQVLIDTAKALGEPTEEIEDKFDTLINATIEEVERAVREIETSGVKELDYTPRFNVDTGLVSENAKIIVKQTFDAFSGEIKKTSEVQREAPEIPARMKVAAETSEDSVKSVKETLSDFFNDFTKEVIFNEDYDILASLFGEDAASELKDGINNLVGIIENEKIGEKLASAFSGIGNIFGFINTGIDEQIQSLEELNEFQDERIEELESRIDRQLELHELELANNLESTQKALDEEYIAREESARKITELKAKQAKLETAQNIAQQASSFSLAIANIYAEHTKIPFVGVLLAAGFVASMIATVKAAKSQLAALNQTTNLYTGGSLGDHLAPSRSSGVIAPHGKSDKPFQGQGYAIVDPITGQDTRMRVGGNEFIVNEYDSVHNRPFLENFNRGEYRGLDLDGILASVDPNGASKQVVRLENRYIESKRSGISREDFNKGMESLKSELSKNRLSAIEKDGQIVIIDPDNITKNKPVIIGSRRIIS